MGENGFDQGRSNTNEPKTTGSPCGQKKSNNSPPKSRKEHLDKFSHGGQPGWLGSVHRNFFRIFDEMIDLKNGLINLRNPNGK